MNPYRVNANANTNANEDDLSREIRAFLKAWYPTIVGAHECIDPNRCARGYGGRFHIGTCATRQS